MRKKEINKEEKTRLIMPDVVGEAIEDAEKILKEKNIEITEVKKKFDLFTKKDYVIKTEPEVGEKVEDKVVVTISRMKLLPLLLLCVLILFGGIMFGTGTISRILTTSAPKIESKTHEWTKSGIVVVTKDAKMIDEVKNYEYCVTKRKTTIGCKWEKTETKNVEISKSGVWNVYFRGIDLKGRKSKVSNRDYVRVDNDAPIIEKVKSSTGATTITLNVDARDEHSGVNTYYYKINDGEYVLGEKEYTLTNLEPNKEYKITIKVVDKVGNESEVEINITTLEDTNADDNNNDDQNNNNNNNNDNNDNNENNQEEVIEPPYIDLNEVPGIMDYQENHKLPSNYDFKNSTGTVSCKVGEKEYTNTKDIPIGNHTIVCTATNKEGMSTTVSKNVRVTSPVTDEELNGWIWLNLHYPANSTKWEWKKIDENEVQSGDDLLWNEYTGPIRVRIEDIDKIYIRYMLDGNEVIISPDGYYVDIEPEKTALRVNETTKVKINYSSNAEKIEYRINNGVWQEYTEEFDVTANTTIDARIIYYLDVYDENGDLLLKKKRTKYAPRAFIKEIVDPTPSTPSTCTGCACVDGSWGVSISSTSGYINNGKPVTISINYEQGATVKQYKIGLYGEWRDYTGPITVSWDAHVFAQAAGYKEINGCTKWVKGGASLDLSYRWYGVRVEPDEHSIDSTETTEVELYTWEKSARISLEYSINGGAWQNYTGRFYVGPNTTIVARASWVLDNGEILTEYGSDTVYENMNGLRTSVNPNTRAVGGLNKAYVGISTNLRAEKIEYTLDNGATWQDYKGAFAVDPNTMVCGRASKTNSNGSVQTSPWDCKWISEDDLGLTIYPSAYAALDGEYVTATIGTRYSVQKIEYSLDNGATWNTYTGARIPVKAGNEIQARAYFKGRVIPQSLTIDILPDPALDGPIISENPTSLTDTATITITTKKKARDVYYRINGGSWQTYNHPFTVDHNCNIDSYYIDDDEGRTSKTSTFRVTNIKHPKLPYVRIDTNPVSYVNGTEESIKASIYAEDYTTLEYSLDGIIYQPYTGELTITKSTTVYALATNEYGPASDSLPIVTKTPSDPPDKLDVEIVANPDTKDLTDSDGNVRLVNKTEVSLLYGNEVTKACYKLGPSITNNMSTTTQNQIRKTLASMPCIDYTGPFIVDKNTTVYAYVFNAKGFGSNQKMIDFLTLGIANPVISEDPTTATDIAKISIKYSRNATVKKYRIDNGTWIDYTGEFEVTANCEIEAINEDMLGNQATSTYKVSNIVKKPNYNILDKGDYYLIRLNYPINSLQTSREYKWKTNGVWKQYDEHGILLIKPSAASKIISPDGVKIKDDQGNDVILTDHYYILDVNIEKIGENLYMKWDSEKVEAPKIIKSDDEVTNELTIAINYNKALKDKLYRVIYDDGTDTGWIKYDRKFKINKKCIIFAKGVDIDGVDSYTSNLRIDNIDSTGPVISISGDMQTPKQKVTLLVSAKDDGAVDSLLYEEGSRKVDYFNDNGIGISNPGTITIEENGKYTFYAVDNLGNETIKEIEITNIDKDAPDIEIKVLSTVIGTSTEVEIDYGDSTSTQYKIGENGTYRNYTGKFTLSSYDLFNLANEDGSLTIYAKGKDQAGNEKEVKEITYVLDLTKIEKPDIVIGDGYPMLTLTEMITDLPVYINYDNKAQDVTNYYSLDNGATWKIYTGGIPFISGKVLAKSVRESTGLETSSEATRVIPTDAIGVKAYDHDLTVSEVMTPNTSAKFTLSSNLVGKTIKIYNGQTVSGNSVIKVYDKNKKLLKTIPFTPLITTFNVDENDYLVEIFSGSISLLVREITVTNENITGDEITIPIIDIDEAGWASSKVVHITYPSNVTVNEYSLDNGETWNAYEGPLKITEPTTVLARISDETGIILGTSSFVITKVDSTEPEIELEVGKNVQKGYDLAIPTYYKIGDSGEDAKCYQGEKEISNLKELEVGTYTITCSVKNETGKEATVSKTISIVNQRDYSGESILKILEENPDMPTGKYSLKVNGEVYPVHVITYDGNQQWRENKTFGDETDVATATEYAKNMVIVKVNGDLNVGKDAVVTTYGTIYGGPKGFTLYVSGTLLNNGTITMTARGAKAVGQDVYLWRNSDGSYEYVPKTGGAGGAAAYTGNQTVVYGRKGQDGINRQTGGGGTGAGRNWMASIYIGRGGYGTSYSGGAGSGASNSDGSGGSYAASSAGSDVGGAGSTGIVRSSNGSGYAQISVGGTGNPSGGSQGYRAGYATYNAKNGTGGLLTIFADRVTNRSVISAEGVSSSTGTPNYGNTRIDAGGSSGGGSVNIFYRANYKLNGTFSANGGASTVLYGGAPGGAGGNGAVTFTQLPSVIINDTPIYPNLTKEGFSSPQREITMSKVDPVSKIYYSLDSGKTWQEYIEPFILKDNEELSFKGLYENGRETDVFPYERRENDVLPENAYDGTKTETATLEANKDYVFTVSSEVEKENLRFFLGSTPSTDASIKIYDKDYKELVNTTFVDKLTVINIPEGAYKFVISGGSKELTINEVNLREEKEIVNDLPIIETNNTDWSVGKIVDIIYPDGYENEYSLDNGITWNIYTEPFTIEKETTIFARTKKDEKVVGSNSYMINKIDIEEPTIELELENEYDHGTDISIPTKYTVGKSLGTPICKTNDKKITNIKDLEKGTYEITCSITNGAKVTKEVSKEITIKVTDEWTFDYTGGEQTFIVPTSGKFKVETWGAQGGSGSGNRSIGGYGGYSTGNLDLNENSLLYINVGGQSISSKIGYNGGGSGQKTAGSISNPGGGGGGATHMSLISGLLSTLENSKDSILIVSGGGGGAGENSGRPGGSGGGLVGSKGTGSCFTPTGGTQITAGTRGDSDASQASFGKGGSAPGGNSKAGTYGAGGGGGGFYGGGAASFKSGDGCASSGAGDSGYIGNQLLTDKSMYCYNCQESTEESTKTISTACVSETPTENCAKIGNGYARITYIGE